MGLFMTSNKSNDDDDLKIEGNSPILDRLSNSNNDDKNSQQGSPFLKSKLTVKEYNCNIDEMNKRIKYLIKKEQLEQSNINLTRQKIKKVINIRKKLESRENMRLSYRESLEQEIEYKKNQINIAKERERINKLTLKISMEQRKKDCQFIFKEMDEEMRQKRYMLEKKNYEVNRYKRDKVKKLTELATQKLKAYESFNKMKSEKQKDKDEELNNKVIITKDVELKNLISYEEELINKINKAKKAK